MFLFFFPFRAFADDIVDGDDKVTTVLENLLNFVSGKWGMSLCSLAVVGVGYACFVRGSVPISRVIAVTVGAACVVGAPRLISLFVGKV